MKSIKLATVVSVMGLAAGMAMAAPEHAVKVPNQDYQEGANAQSAQQQNADAHHYYRTITAYQGK